MSGLTMFMSSEHDDSLSPNACPLDIAEKIGVMRSQETTTYKCRNYIDDNNQSCSIAPPLSHCPQDELDMPVDRDCRVKMCEWCYQVTDFCKFKRETVAISMSYLDRFLSTSRTRALLALKNRKDYQLAAMTSLYIAIKLFEPMAMDTELLSAISHGCYTENDIVEMEQEILTALAWRVNGPTAHDFLSHIMALLPVSTYKYDDSTAMTLLDYSRFQVEIAVCDYDLALQKHSTVALAAILNSAEGIDEKLLSRRARFDFFKCISDVTGLNPFSMEVNAVRQRLLDLFAQNSGYELQQVANHTPVYSMKSRSSDLSAPSSPVSVRSFTRLS